MKKILYFVVALLCAGCSYADNKHFDTMVIFGDSLSDNGNLYHFLWQTLPVSPPYYEGHFSNGTLWAEQLYSSYFPADYTEGLQNYAVGGAGAVLSYKQHLPYTLVMELDNYLYWHTYGKKDTTLFAIWIGGNNYLNGPINIEPITDAVVNAIGGTIERLIKVGGDKFLIPNLPDLARTPYSKEYGTQILLNELVKRHNSKLAVKIAELQDKYPEVTFIYFDIYSFFNEALDHANDYGFSNSTEACYLGGYVGWLKKPDDSQLQSYLKTLNPHLDSTNWELISNDPELKEALTTGYLYRLLPASHKENISCDDYVFWDRIHPTTQAHRVIAEKARQLLDEAGIYPFLPTASPK
ncbi:SGNH/GDSL hydrolase family protein [Legionella sp. km772]|uniref:SGNH/GDSL hydrolase family protein n=1 Tax=Legionella sp. km772 TaxID=2498111 RepID=UPI000F8E71BB|nr:SGNH/GDSL hydrolase family protein [Legionella sp. km772]RUR12717.1 hypothetical protein ELY15_04300 [Legionella sp. km772]